YGQVHKSFSDLALVSGPFPILFREPNNPLHVGQAAFGLGDVEELRQPVEELSWQEQDGLAFRTGEGNIQSVEVVQKLSFGRSVLGVGHAVTDDDSLGL